MNPAPASIFAVELIGELIRRGVSDVVVCPGSRSQALALAAAAAERAGAIRLHVRIDERSAGFFALGVARETGMPAAVIVTSGTAVANLAPAVLEAHEGRVPLLLLTADRPEELRGIRSNQTTRQAGLFVSVARLALDVDASAPTTLAEQALTAALGAPGAPPAGPVHLNLAFREPLSGTQGFDRMIADGFRAAAEERQGGPAASGIHRHPAAAADGRRAERAERVEVTQDLIPVYTHSDSVPTVVIAGADADTAAAEFAEAAGLPLYAEVVSGARVGAAIPNYVEQLDDPTVASEIRRAIVFGHPTLTRQVPALLRRDDVEVIVVDPHTDCDHYDPSHSARIVRAATVRQAVACAERASSSDPAAGGRVADLTSAVAGPCLAASTVGEDPEGADPEGGIARSAQERTHRVRSPIARALLRPDGAQSDALLRAPWSPLTREALALAVWNATQPDDRLVLAASRLVRVLDRIAPARDVRVHANRGLAGIDGTIATALGVSAARGARDAVTRVLIGDLALLHDAGSLLLAPGEPRPRVQVVVGNDGGGTIFDGLEVAGSADPEAFERVMTTPQRVDLAALAAAYGWAYARAETAAELDAALAAPSALAGPDGPTGPGGLAGPDGLTVPPTPIPTLIEVPLS